MINPLSYAIPAYCISQAILEDYAIYMAKIEGISAEEVKNRINAHAKELYKKSIQSPESSLNLLLNSEEDQ